MEGLHERTEHLNIFIFLLPITQRCSMSKVLFTGGRGVSDFSVLKYYQLNINYSVNILSECLHILFDCSQLSKMYYNVLFGSSTRDCHYDGRLSLKFIRFCWFAKSTVGGGDLTRAMHVLELKFALLPPASSAALQSNLLLFHYQLTHVILEYWL